jgi:hypothetical protein
MSPQNLREDAAGSPSINMRRAHMRVLEKHTLSYVKFLACISRLSIQLSNTNYQRLAFGILQATLSYLEYVSLTK